MTKTFESIKAGLKQAIAHQQNKPNMVVMREVAPRRTTQDLTPITPQNCNGPVAPIIDAN